MIVTSSRPSPGLLTEDVILGGWVINIKGSSLLTNVGHKAKCLSVWKLKHTHSRQHFCSRCLFLKSNYSNYVSAIYFSLFSPSLQISTKILILPMLVVVARLSKNRLTWTCNTKCILEIEYNNWRAKLKYWDFNELGWVFVWCSLDNCSSETITLSVVSAKFCPKNNGKETFSPH